MGEIETFYGLEENEQELISDYNGDIDAVHDKWDDYYGNGIFDYTVYVLQDGTKSGKWQFGPFEFKHEPFYVGSGKKNRPRQSCKLTSNDWDNNRPNAKIVRLKEIAKKGGKIYWNTIGMYQTKKKSLIVEKKIMNLISRELLTNTITPYCSKPLTENDYSNYWKKKSITSLEFIDQKSIVIWEQFEERHYDVFPTRQQAEQYLEIIVEQSKEMKYNIVPDSMTMISGNEFKLKESNG